MSEENKRTELVVGNYTIKENIGRGSFATVYKAQHKQTQQIVAVKSVKRSKLTKKLLESLESEISILTSIRHDHIVGLIDCQKTERNIYLVMEYCSLGDLSHYIKQAKGSKVVEKGRSNGLPESVVRHFLKQLANALQFLRSQDLVHRDIKPQNLLLAPNPNSQEFPVLKVADFGFARFLPNASLADTLCGSPLYMGPEILSYKKYDAKADLWSVGAVLYETVSGEPPFKANNHVELSKKIEDANDRIQFLQPPPSEDLQDLIKNLLKRNPVDRISFDDFFSHPAIQMVKKPTRFYNSPPSIRTIPVSQDYEPPPFAQISPNRNIFNRTSVKTENKSFSKEDDGLGEYVLVDKKAIEKNQFVDGKERKQSTGSSAGSTLAKAVSSASSRLDPPILSPPKEPVGSPRGFMSIHQQVDRGTLHYIESMACMAHVVSRFADQKYETNRTRADTEEECMMLYVKSLALLESGLDVAKNYWEKSSGQLEEKKEMERFNAAVQWMRDKFNECLERAESFPYEDTSSFNSTCVEKLLYDRSLEMSRQTAVYELVGENITHCEQDYQTAIWMLEAILHVRPNDDIIIEDKDKQIITEFILSIRNRIIVLRKKLESAERV